MVRSIPKFTAKSLVVSALLIGTSIATPASAAFEKTYNAVICRPLNATHAANLAYSAFGVHNAATSGSRAEVACTMELTSPQDVDAISVYVYDRNPTQEVGCIMRLEDAQGFQIAFATDNTTGSSADSMLVDGGFVNGSYSMAHLHCFIPIKSGSNFSHVTSVSYRHP